MFCFFLFVLNFGFKSGQLVGFSFLLRQIRSVAVNRIMVLRLRIFVVFLVCCVLIGVGVGFLEVFFVVVVVVFIICNVLVGFVMFLVFFRKKMLFFELFQLLEVYFYWNFEISRRGMGDFIRSVNYIVIIVSDVGRFLVFYIEIIGFQ